MCKYARQQLSVNSGDLVNPDTEILHGDGEMGGASGLGQEVELRCCVLPDLGRS